MYLKILLALTMLVFSTPRTSAQTNRMLVLELFAGTTNSFLLAEEPVITFSDGYIDVSSESTSVYYKLSEVANYHFEDASTGIKAVEADEIRVVSINADKVSIEGLDGNGVVRVFDTTGMQMPVAATHNGTYTEVSIGTLPAGVYIIKAGNQSLKIRKR